MKLKTKINIIAALLVFSAFVLMSGCFETHRWTEKEKKNFECKCIQTDTFSNESIGFKGFENDEFDSVTINEFKDTVLLRSFKIFVSFVQNNDQGMVKTRWGTVNRTMNTTLLPNNNSRLPTLFVVGYENDCVVAMDHVKRRLWMCDGQLFY